MKEKGSTKTGVHFGVHQKRRVTNFYKFQPVWSRHSFPSPAPTAWFQFVRSDAAKPPQSIARAAINTVRSSAPVAGAPLTSAPTWGYNRGINNAQERGDMALTEVKIKAARSKDKPYKLFDGEGLYLLVHPNGSKYWRVKFRHHGKENTYAVGVYPPCSLAQARDEKYAIRKQVKGGVNPNARKKTVRLDAAIQANNSIQSVALEWHAKNEQRWTPRHALKLKRWIDQDICPFIGPMPIAEVKPMHVLEIMRAIEARGAFDVTREVLSLCSRIFRYAIPLGLCEYDVTTGIGQTLTSVKSENYRCISPGEFPQLIGDIEQHPWPLTKLALKLIILTFVRTSELRYAKWSEIDLKKNEWRIPAERMKMREQHLVPLSRQSVALLAEIRALKKKGDYLFPNENDPAKVMSENTMLFALYDMGYKDKMTVHGFRQLASTLLNENGFPPDVIERQLAHTERNKVRRAYNHAQYLPQRREMMQWWADYIGKLIP